MPEKPSNSEVLPDRARQDESTSAPLPVMEYAPAAHPQCPKYRRVMCWAMGIAGVGILAFTMVQWVISKRPDPELGEGLLVGVGLVVWSIVIRWQHVQFHLFRNKRN